MGAYCRNVPHPFIVGQVQGVIRDEENGELELEYGNIYYIV